MAKSKKFKDWDDEDYYDEYVHKRKNVDRRRIKKMKDPWKTLDEDKY